MAKSDVLVRMKADTTGYDANIAKARRQLDNFKKDNLSMGGVLKQLNSNLLATATRFASVTAAVGALGAAFKSNIETAKNFEKSMSQLSSLTGMVGDDLNKLKEYAIELGSTTTLSASEVADAFKMIGSQQPQLLESGEALKKVTKYAITLSEAAGIDLATAAQTLSTSINQMGGDSENAVRFVNVLAAASQKGAGDIAWLGEAVTKSGTTAKAVGTSYEELVANLEQLAKAGFDASTAGTALRSIIMNLEKQANNDFKPSVVGLTQAFNNLGKANLDIVGYQEIAGKMFASQAKALADAAEEAKNMTAAITGTNTAEEQAKVNTDNLEGSLKSLSSAWEGFNLHLNSSNGLFRDIVDGLKDIVVWADKVILKLGEVPNPEDVLTKNLPEVGSNVDDKGNYIKRPAQRGAVGFDWESGTWKPGYSGAIYNGATGQTELPEITVAGTKITKTTPKKGGSKTTKVEQTEMQTLQKQIQELEQEYIKLGGITTEDADKRRGEIQSEIHANETRINQIKLLGEQAHGRLLGGVGVSSEGLGANSFAFDGNALQKNLDYVLEQIKVKPIQIPIETATDNVKKLQDTARTTAKVVGTIGTAFNAIEDPAAKVAAVVAQAIANVALAYSDALAKTTAEKFNIWSFIAASASAMISMGTTIASIHQATGYAEGGMIKGNSYSGDRIGGLVDGSQLVGLNAGEVVLNAAQQSSLANQLQNNGQTIRVVGKLHGKDLFICAENWSKSAGHGEFVTW